MSRPLWNAIMIVALGPLAYFVWWSPKAAPAVGPKPE